MKHTTARSGRRLATVLANCLARALMLGAFPVLLLASPRPPKHTSDEAASALLVDSKVIILESPDAPIPIQKATEDLRNDFQAVLGAKPRLVTRQQDAGPITIWIGEQSTLSEALRTADLTGPESFSISVTSVNWNSHAPTHVILLAGADLRGTIYAIYQFSQQYLGTDPMYYWTDYQPPRRPSISIPSSLSQTFPAPLFKYRGFFINDEDLLTGWAPGEETDHSGISLAVMDKIYETILRLKGNMVVPGTWIFPDDPQVKAVAQRGLILTQHHAIPLGLNVARWPADVAYNYTTHPEVLERAWKNAVNSYDPHQEILWDVGLRGLSDVSYASMDPTVRDNDQALGHLISAAIGEQMKIVREVRPDAKFVTNFWQEGARLVQQGDLTIPPDVIPVWADTGYGLLQDKGLVATGQGAYYHVAMLNGRANQLSEMLPVDRIYSELGRYIKAGATRYLLLNTSDIRPVSMTAKAVMDTVWGGVPQAENGSEQYYRQWSAKEFGEKSAAAVSKVYEAYFKAPAHAANGDDYGDQMYQSEVRQMLMSYMVSPPYYAIPSQSPKWTPVRILGIGVPPPGGVVGALGSAEYLQQAIKRELQLCGDAQPRWDAVWKEALAAEPLVEPARRPFYRAEVLTMIAINRDSNRILFLVSNALQDIQSGQKARARQKAQEALAAFDEIHKFELEAEYGKWKNWYRGDWLCGIDQTRALVETFVKFLDDPMTTLPPPVLANGWEGYYHIMHYEGSRSANVQ